MHYHGDTTNYLPGGRLAHHGRFDGNGRVRHTGGVYSDWKTSDWADDHSMNHYFSIIDGVVTVKEQGLYYIYAQVRDFESWLSQLSIDDVLIDLFDFRYFTMMTMT